MNAKQSAVGLSALLVLSLAANGYLGWENYDRQRQVDRLQSQLSKASSAGERSDSARGDTTSITTDLGGEIFLERKSVEIKKTPRFSEEPVTCSLCQGEGKLNLRTSRKTFSSYPCPVCAARGAFVIRVPYQGEICQTCGGVGRIGVPSVYDETATHSARICVPCNGSGWIKKRA